MEQLEIVKRYLLRLRRMYNGDNSLEWNDREFHKDDVYSFFIHCNHLRDWIFKLNKIDIRKIDIDNLIKNNKPLQICADLANSKKHCRLEFKTWSGTKPHICLSCHHSAIMKEKGIISEFTIISGNDSYDALELAEDCFLIWNNFIEEYKQRHITNHSTILAEAYR